jgi:hypothetical protein
MYLVIMLDWNNAKPPFVQIVTMLIYIDDWYVGKSLYFLL